MGASHSEHLIEPARREFDVVVEQEKIFTSGECSGAIVGASVAEIFLIENDSNFRPGKPDQRLQPLPRAIAAAIVDQNNFALKRRIARQRFLEGAQRRLGQREAVVERDDERNVHANDRVGQLARTSLTAT